MKAEGWWDEAGRPSVIKLAQTRTSSGLERESSTFQGIQSALKIFSKAPNKRVTSQTVAADTANKRVQKGNATEDTNASELQRDPTVTYRLCISAFADFMCLR